MTLYQLCCSIESAKRLRELGFRNKSLFGLVLGDNDRALGIKYYNEITEKKLHIYTAAELLEMLPDEIFHKKDHVLTVNTLGLPRLYYVHYICYGYELIKNYTGHLNFAEACALCLIHLLENKLVSLEEVNK